MNFSSWLLEFCSAFYTTYTSCGANNEMDILATVTTAATFVGAPNVYIEVNDVQNMKTTSMYVESLSDEELAQFRQNLEFDITYQDLDLDTKDITNIKTL